MERGSSLPGADSLRSLRAALGGDRAGRQATLSWQDLTFSIGEKEILKNVTGILEPGHLTGILGPSGSGKTTLLNVLSGRQRTYGKVNGQHVAMSGEVALSGDGTRPSRYREQVAYVYQDVALAPSETPRECLDFSAYLRLSKSVSDKDRAGLVDSMLESLRLKDCADTLIGSALQKGISGGQKKRVAVGVELISNPRLLFLDEPLSGLDSYNAKELVSSLKELARSGVPVLMTLHQPSSDMFAKLDQVIVLHGGEVCFHGAAKQLAAHFRGLGFDMPPNHNPADDVLCVIQQDKEGSVRRIKDQWAGSDACQGLHARIEQSSAAGARDQDGHGTSSSESSSEEEVGACAAEDHPPLQTRRGCFLALRKLLEREMRSVKRSMKVYVWELLIFKLIVAVLYGCFFFQQGRRADLPDGEPNCRPGAYKPVACSSDFTGHFSALSLVSITLVIESMTFTLSLHHGMRSIFVREMAGGYYGVVPYYIAKTVTEGMLVLFQCVVLMVGTYWLIGFRSSFPTLILGLLLIAMTSSSMMWCASARCKTREEAAALCVCPWILQFAFSGLLLPIQQIPAFVRWLRWICPIYYGLGFLADTEFRFLYTDYKAFGALADTAAAGALANASAAAGALANATAAPFVLDVPQGVALRRSMLESMDIHFDGRWWPYFGMCGVLFIAYRSLATLLLWRSTRFVA